MLGGALLFQTCWTLDCCWHSLPWFIFHLSGSSFLSFLWAPPFLPGFSVFEFFMVLFFSCLISPQAYYKCRWLQWLSMYTWFPHLFLWPHLPSEPKIRISNYQLNCPLGWCLQSCSDPMPLKLNTQTYPPNQVLFRELSIYHVGIILDALLFCIPSPNTFHHWVLTCFTS